VISRPAPVKTKSGACGAVELFTNAAFLELQRQVHQTAALQGKKHCLKCGFCCLRRPCVPTPEEFKVIAAFLRLTPQELAQQYAVVDERLGKYHILWANEAQTDVLGTLLSPQRTWDKGYCLFFDRKTANCRIWPVRPLTAKVTKCWVEKSPSCDSTDSWSLEQIQELLPNFDEISKDDDEEDDEEWSW